MAPAVALFEEIDERAQSRWGHVGKDTLMVAGSSGETSQTLVVDSVTGQATAAGEVGDPFDAVTMSVQGQQHSGDGDSGVAHRFEHRHPAEDGEATVAKTASPVTRTVHA